MVLTLNNKILFVKNIKILPSYINDVKDKLITLKIINIKVAGIFFNIKLCEYDLKFSEGYYSITKSKFQSITRIILYQ